MITLIDPTLIPAQFLCRLTQEIMFEPLLDTQTQCHYEHAAINQWLLTQQPATDKVMPASLEQLQPDLTLKQSITDWLQAKPEYLNHLLLTAAQKGLLAQVSYYLELGADINAQDQDAKTPLYLAIEHKQPAVVDYLLALKPDLTPKCFQGISLLGIACKAGSLTLVKRLEQRGLVLNKNVLSYELDSLLHFAAFNDDVPLVQYLFEQGFTVDIQNLADQLPLHCAASAGQTAVVEYLLAQGSAVNSQDELNYTPLHHASQRGELATIQLLLDAGADTGLKTNKGHTPLDLAVERKATDITSLLLDKTQLDDKTQLAFTVVAKGNLELARKLIGDGGLVHEVDKKGDTLLHIAANKGHAVLIQWLYEQGANIHTRNKEGYSPLAKAMNSYSSNLAAIITLLKLGADVQTKDRSGQTVLHKACAKAGLAEVTRLLELGVDIHAKTNDGETVLHQAMVKGDVTVLNKLLELGLDIHAKTHDNRTALHYAATPEAIQLCLDHGLDVNARDSRGRTPLFGKATDNLLDCVNLLIQYGADANAKDNRHQTALTLPAMLFSCSVQICKALLKAGASVVDLDEDGNNLLHLACFLTNLLNDEHFAVLDELLTQGLDVYAKNKQGKNTIDLAFSGGTIRASMLHYFLKKGVDLSNLKTDDDKTLLHCATYNNDSAFIRDLIAAGFDIHAKHKGSKTPLHLAVIYNSPLAVKCLLEHGAYKQDKTEKTLLHKAALNGSLQTMNILLGHGISIDSTDGDGLMPLHYAASSQYYATVAYLLDQGVWIELKSPKFGLTPLHCAAEYEQLKTMKYLLTRGADITATDNVGDMPLHCAAIRNRYRAVDFLLQQGIAVDIQQKIFYSKMGLTALQRAAQHGCYQTVKLLMRRGANVAIQTPNGCTAMHFAAQGGDVAIIKLFAEAGVGVNSIGNGKTPLYFAIAERNLEAVKCLHHFGADLSIRLAKQDTLLHWTAQQNEYEFARWLLAHSLEHSINQKNDDGKTALHLARSQALKEILIIHGADLDCADNERKTPLNFIPSNEEREHLRQLHNQRYGHYNWSKLQAQAPTLYSLERFRLFSPSKQLQDIEIITQRDRKRKREDADLLPNKYRKLEP